MALRVWQAELHVQGPVAGAAENHPRIRRGNVEQGRRVQQEFHREAQPPARAEPRAEAREADERREIILQEAAARTCEGAGERDHDTGHRV